MIEIAKIITYFAIVITSASTQPDFDGTYCYDARDTNGRTGIVYSRLKYEVGDTIKFRVERPIVAREVPTKD